jgi:hypothetical protein
MRPAVRALRNTGLLPAASPPGPAANQQILTQGLPTDAARAILRVTGSGLTTAISGHSTWADGISPACG